MTVAELIILLSKCQQDMPVMQSIDSEGNGYRSTSEVALMHWDARWHDSHDVSDETPANTVCLWPE